MKRIFAIAALAISGCATLPERPSNDEIAKNLRASAQKEFDSLAKPSCEIVHDFGRKDEGREVTVCYDLVCPGTFGHAIGCLTDSVTPTGGKTRTTRIRPY